MKKTKINAMDRISALIIVAIAVVAVLLVVSEKWVLAPGKSKTPEHEPFTTPAHGVNESQRQVLVELFVTSYCTACPSAEKTLAAMVKDYPICLVTLVIDENEHAYNRAINYGISATPTAVFDLGYRVAVGTKSEAEYANIIAECLKRSVPLLAISAKAENTTEDVLAINATIKNNANTSFEGGALMFVVEPESRYINANGEHVRYGFVGYAGYETIYMDAHTMATVHGTWNESYSTEENLAIVVAVFDHNYSVTASIIYL